MGRSWRLATYDTRGQHFEFTDWLGTKRAQATAAGVLEEQCQSLPFGDGLNCSGSGVDATEHHFMGKERDAESGNDFFGARYYNSTTGRFLSPDWSLKAEPAPYAKLDLPQTLNLYAFVGNNPLTHTDVDGHVTSDPVSCVDPGNPCQAHEDKVIADKKAKNDVTQTAQKKSTSSSQQLPDDPISCVWFPYRMTGTIIQTIEISYTKLNTRMEVLPMEIGTKQSIRLTHRLTKERMVCPEGMN